MPRLCQIRCTEIIQILIIFGCYAEPDSHKMARSMADSSIAYGGVLNLFVPDVLPNDTAIRRVAQFAVDVARRSVPDSVPSTDEGALYPYQIIEPKKMKVIYTQDDKEPFVLQALDEETMKSVSHPLTWGINYYFKMTWPDLADTFTHSFMISEHWDKKLYIFEHTFYKQANRSERSNIYGDTKKKHQQPDTSKTSQQDDLHMDVHAEHIPKSERKIKDQKELKEEVPLNMRESTTEGHPRPYSSSEHIQNIPQADQGSCSSDSCPSGLHNITLKILSFNIWNFNVVHGGEKQYAARIQHLADLCRKSEADVIGFQEVRFEEGKGGDLGYIQVQHLSSMLPGYQFVYQAGQIHRTKLPNKVEEGIAFFSKYPIVSHDYWLLHRDPQDNADSHQRVLLHVELQLPQAKNVHLFNTHLSLSHLARQTSVVQIWNYVNQFEGPAFVIGDFNAEAHNDEIKFLDGRTKLKGIQTSGLHDVWLMKHGSKEKGFTYTTLRDGLFKRIDLIFMRDHHQVSLLDVALLDDGTRQAAAASDHLGLLGTFSIIPEQ